MKNLLLRVGAIALALMPSLASAQIAGTKIQAPAGFLPAYAAYCDDGTGHAVICTSSGGGTGGGDASAANQLIISARIGDTAAPAAGSLNYRLNQLLTATGSPLQAGGTVIVGSSALPTGAATDAKSEAIRAQLAAGIAVTGPATDAQMRATPIPVDTVVKGTGTDRGGSFGATATQLMAANLARRGFAVQVQSTTASCYINGTATATADYHSLQIAPGTYYETPSTHAGTGALSIICTAAGISVYAREW